MAISAATFSSPSSSSAAVAAAASVSQVHSTAVTMTNVRMAEKCASAGLRLRPASVTADRRKTPSPSTASPLASPTSGSSTSTTASIPVERAFAAPSVRRSQSDVPVTSPQQDLSLHRQSHVSVSSPLWQAIAEDGDSIPPPLPPRPLLHSGATPASNTSLKLKTCVKRGGQRLKKVIGVCKSLPATSASSAISPEPGSNPPGSTKTSTSRRLSLPSSDFERLSLPRPLQSRRGSDGALQLTGKRPQSKRALPPEPVHGIHSAAANKSNTVAAGRVTRTRSELPPSLRPSSTSSAQSPPESTDTSPVAMSAPPIAPRPAHTLTEKASSGSSGYSSRGQSPAHHHPVSTTSSDLSPEGRRRQCKESISLPISRTSSSDHLSPTLGYLGRRGSQDSGTQSMEQSPTNQKGMKAGLKRMVVSLKRGATTPKKKLPTDSCLSPPTPDLTSHSTWPSTPPGHSTASDEALIRAHRAATAAFGAANVAYSGGHAPLQRCSASSGTRPLMATDRAVLAAASSHAHPHHLQHQHHHQHHPHQQPHHYGQNRRDPQIIGRAHSLPAHSVNSVSHHSQANRQLSGGHLDQSAVARKGFDYNAKYRAFDWFFGRMSRDRAQRLLMDFGTAGNYLLRERDTYPGEYAISVKARQTVLHFRVYCDNHGYLCNKDASSCPTLIDLVRYHTTVPLTGNSNGSDGVFYLERPLNRALIPASEGIPPITNSSSSLGNSISRQNSSDLQDINEELYLEPLPCSVTPSDSEASKADETEDDKEIEEAADMQDDGGIYIDEEGEDTTGESTA